MASRQAENDASPQSGQQDADLAGITINVYELEVKGEGEDEGREKTSPSANGSSSAGEEESTKDEEAAQPEDSELYSKTSLLNQLRYANIVVYCAKCSSEVPVCTLQYHRTRHRSLETLHYSAAPRTLRALLQRRNRKMENLVRKSFTQEGQLIRSIHKVNVAFELLKKEVEGECDISQITRAGNWREKDIKSVEKRLNSSLSLGICRYRKPDSASNIKCVHLDSFVAPDRGVFLGIYQGYCGSHVTSLCKRDLHREIQNKLRNILESSLRPSIEQVKSIIRQAYENIDYAQLMSDEERSWNRWSGCSAVTCLMFDDLMYIANEGNLQGLLVRENNTLKVVTSCHNLYNRRERLRVRNCNGFIVKTEKCALVNGVLGTTRGLGNIGDGLLKACVINKPRVRVVSVTDEDKILVLASEGLWRVFHYREVFYLIQKFVRDALALKTHAQKEKSNTPSPAEMDFLRSSNTGDEDRELKYLLSKKKERRTPIDFQFNVPKTFVWQDNIPDITVRRATIVPEEEPLTDSRREDLIQIRNFSNAEKNDEDLRKLASVISLGSLCAETQPEISRLLSKRLLKSALIAGADINSIVMVLLLPGFKIE